MSAVAYFAIRDDNEQGLGTQESPYNGSTAAHLDEILENVITSDMTLIFGPGVFQTKGSGGATLGWNIKDRTRIIGSGMNATVLQLVGASVPAEASSARVAIIRSTVHVTDIEISDLTLDVNLARQPKLADQSNAALCGQGTLIFGNNVMIRRVRVINWGTYTISLECFPIFVEGGNSDTSGPPGQVVVEDCIVEHPALSQARESTMVNVHTHIEHLGILSTSRNSYANGNYVAGSPELATDVASITYPNSVMNVTTKWPHRLRAGDDVVIQGSSVAAYNGRFTVTDVPSTPVPVRTFEINAAGLPNPPGSAAGITVRRYVPSPLKLKSITYSGSLVTVETYETHFRKVSEPIRVSGVKVNGSEDE